MQDIMYEVMEMCGFNFEPTTFGELFRYGFLAILGTCLIACMIKILLWVTFNAKRLF